MKKTLYIIALLIIVCGAIIYKTKGFNKELFYSNRNQILVSSSKEFDLEKINQISKEVLTNRKVKVQEHERFGNAVEIVSTSISEEEKESLINKINENYSTTISKDDVKILNVPNTRIKDIIKPYILPIILTWASCLLYYIIIYNKIGLAKILEKGLVFPLLIILCYYGIVLIAQIPFGRVTNALGLGLYIMGLFVSSINFQKEKTILSKKENDE